jgi:hypothetical protein
MERCQRALAVVQRDLDATGYDEFQMRPVNLRVDPGEIEVFEGLPNGDSWSGGGVGGMTPDMDDNDLLWYAAASVSDTLIEVLWIAWPICAQHGGQPMAPPHLEQAPGGLIQGKVWWWCQRGDGHAVARVGTLTTNHATRRR